MPEDAVTPIRRQQHCTAITFQLKVNLKKMLIKFSTESTLINTPRVNFQDKQLCSVTYRHEIQQINF